MERLLERANDAILILDPTGKVLDANRRAEEMLGRPAAEIVGRPYEDFARAAEPGHEKAWFQKLTADGAVRTDNVLFRRADSLRLVGKLEPSNRSPP